MTVLKRWDGCRIWYPNSLINVYPILNLTRSENKWEFFKVRIAGYLTLSQEEAVDCQHLSPCLLGDGLLPIGRWLTACKSVASEDTWRLHQAMCVGPNLSQNFIMVTLLGLPLCTEAPVTTPNGIDFSVLFFSSLFCFLFPFFFSW